MIVFVRYRHLLELVELDLKSTSYRFDFKTPLRPPAGEFGSVWAPLVSGRGSCENTRMRLPLLCFGVPGLSPSQLRRLSASGGPGMLQELSMREESESSF